MKRFYAPKQWQIKRKGIKFVSRPNPGPHSFRLSMPLNLVIRDLLEYAKNTGEVRRILQNKNVIIDGIRRKDHKFPVGFMDTIVFKETNDYFRVVLNKKGKIALIKIEKNEANLKLCKIIGKSNVKGKTQLNLYDGRNILLDKNNYKVGDSLLINLPKQEIKQHLKSEKGVFIYLIGGKHIGETGIVEDVVADKIKYKKDSNVYETLKAYAFVIGKEKQLIKIEEKK